MARSRTESVLVWFRHDLRLADHAALTAAAKTGLSVIPVFVGGPEGEAIGACRAASRWWLHRSLQQLDGSLQARESRLIVRQGLALEAGARRIFCHSVYEPEPMAFAARLAERLAEHGIRLECFNGSLLFAPGEIRTAAGGCFRVFTPFWNAMWRMRDGLRSPLPAPNTLRAPARWPRSLPVEALGLEPRIDWAAGLRTTWKPGEAEARRQLRAFARGPVRSYGQLRDRTDATATSRLSPHLHFGEISPVQVWSAAAAASGAEPYLRQLAWREFAYHVLCAHPESQQEPLQVEFRRFPWRRNVRQLHAWQQGRTGYPFVDAGMRELWATGWMHNRARLVTASFLVKHLLQPWQEGAAWFLDTLVDADLANNTMGWQWVAGCGVDAAPYFRIFNPVLQGKKFDPRGDCVRRWVPELRRLPARWIHQPWAAPPAVLAEAGVQLGVDYPRPIVDAAHGRRAALAAYAVMRRAKAGTTRRSTAGR